MQVRARHLGRKWVLRACGRALFRETAKLWEEGRVRFIHNVGLTLQEPFLSQQHALVSRVTGKQRSFELAWERLKTYHAYYPDTAGMGPRPGLIVNGEYLAGLCVLAENKRWNNVMSRLDMMWNMTFQGDIESLEQFRRMWESHKDPVLNGMLFGRVTFVSKYVRYDDKKTGWGLGVLNPVLMCALWFQRFLLGVTDITNMDRVGPILDIYGKHLDLIMGCI